METPVESEVVLAAQNGDRQSLGLLVDRYLPLVHNLVGRALPDDPDADDVVQETMIQLIGSLSTLRDPLLFRSWLVTITIRKIQDHARRGVRNTARLRSMEMMDDEERPEPDFVDATIVGLHLTGLRREVAEATRLISRDDQQLLALWWQEIGGTIDRTELAQASNISREHAAVRVQRLRARLDVARLLIRALRHRYRCPELQQILPVSVTDADPKLLSQVSRHVNRCERCRAQVDEMPSPERLLRGVALLPLSATLVSRVSDLLTAAPASTGGAASLATKPLLLASKPVMAVGAVLATVTLALGFAVYHLPDGGEKPRQPVPTGLPSAAPAVAPPPSDHPVVRSLPSPSASALPVVRDRVSASGAWAADVFVAPGGDDKGRGTIDDPYATVSKAVSVVRPGQVIALRGGRYRPRRPVAIRSDGTIRQPIVLTNYRHEVPVLDASGVGGGQPFITHSAAHWTVQGLQITGARDVSYRCDSCHDNVFRRLRVHDGQATGFVVIGPGSSHNTVVDSDFYGNHDDAEHGADADGLSIHSGSGQDNVVRGCRFFRNADDGFDIEAYTGAVTVEGSWSFENGINRWGLDRFAGSGHGFRLGGEGAVSDHLVVDDAAWSNAGDGFSQATNSRSRVHLTRNTAYLNTKLGFDLPKSRSILTGNLSLDNARYPELSDDAVQRGNSWNDEAAWDVSRLLTLHPSGVTASRTADGKLPSVTFLKVRGGGPVGASMRS